MVNYMNIQDFLIGYKNFISTDSYLALNILVIIVSFFTGKISAIIMSSQLSKKRYGEILELLKNDKNKLNESWKEAFTCLSKANTYLCLALFLVVQFVLIIFTADRDGITTTVLMFTAAVSIMEYRDNRHEYKRREKVLSEEQLNLILQAEELRDIEIQDKVLTELENKGLIDKEKRKEIIKNLTH